MSLREHGGRHYAVQFSYVLQDDAWHVELSEAESAPESWADLPNSPTHLPGPAFLWAEVPDEDPASEPTIHLDPRAGHSVPYEIVRWFMTLVAEEVERCRADIAARGSEDG